MRWHWLVSFFLTVGALAGQAGAQTDSGSAEDSQEVSLTVMSFNLRYGSANDGPNAWPLRRELLIETIRNADPDLLGTQETLDFQAQYLQEQLPDLAYVGRSREADPSRGEQCALYYRRSRFDKLAEGHFWLSPSPDRPGSKGWDAALPRMATWVRLWDRQARRPLLLLNTHFDHVGREARTESAQVIADFLGHVHPPLPLIATGDFNLPAENSAAYDRLVNGMGLVDAYRKAQPTPADEEGTFNGFEGRTTGARIDWILVSPELTVASAKIDRTQRDGKYPSDHFPVIAQLTYPAAEPEGTTQTNGDAGR